MFQRKTGDGRSLQALISPRRAALTDSVQETQQLQTSGKRRQNINP